MNDPNFRRTGYRKTEVGWIPADWRPTNIGKVRSYLGSGISRPFFDEPSRGGVPVLRSNNVKAGQVETDDIKYWYDPDPRGADLDAVKPRVGDILINFVNGSRKELGKAGVFRGNPKGCIVSTNFFIFRPDPRIADSDFLAYHFASDCYRRWLHRTVGFSGPGSFNQQQIASHLIPLPPFPEQQKIAKILSTWDNAIAQVGALIESKRQQKKALMQQLLTGHRRLPGFKGEWKWPKAHCVFDRRSSKSGGDEPVLSVTQDAGIVIRSELGKRIDYDENNTANYKIVEPGDFVISLRSFQGGLEISQVRGRVSPAYHVIRAVKPISESFFKHYFKSYEFIKRLDVAVIGIRDGKQVSYDDFSFLKLPFPSIQEQRAIAAVLDTADKEITSLDAKLEALRQQKKGLMQRLLTGQVRVKTA